MPSVLTKCLVSLLIRGSKLFTIMRVVFLIVNAWKIGQALAGLDCTIS